MEQNLHLVNKKRCCFCKPFSHPFPKFFLSLTVNSVPNNIKNENNHVQTLLWHVECGMKFSCGEQGISENWQVLMVCVSSFAYIQFLGEKISAVKLLKDWLSGSSGKLCETGFFPQLY